MSKIKILKEDGVPINNVGDGKIAGLGVGPQGEPPVRKKRLVLLKRNNKNTANDKRSS